MNTPKEIDPKKDKKNSSTKRTEMLNSNKIERQNNINLLPKKNKAKIFSSVNLNLNVNLNMMNYHKTANVDNFKTSLNNLTLTVYSIL